ncbi:hypothetical protein O0L34_g3158 [Tuta absoluta]|nr:hypothetical protein O0L34_g3158 [Tuta absoluta]
MAKRRQWKEELKQKNKNFCEDEEDNKKPKIEVTSEIIMKNGRKVRSFRREGNSCKIKYYLPEETTFHPDGGKPRDVKNLTPTFRKPKAYITETRRVIENISSNVQNGLKNTETLVLAKELSQPGEYHEHNNENDLDDIAKIVQPITSSPLMVVKSEDTHEANLFNTVEETTNKQYQVLVTVDSDHSITSPEKILGFQNESNTEIDSKQIPNAEVLSAADTRDIKIEGDYV